jgi:hypothetical protein
MTNTYAGFRITPLDVVRNVDDNYLIFGKFNGSADYFRISYKEDAYDNTYYYTETEEVSDTSNTGTDTPENPTETDTTNMADILRLKKYILGITLTADTSLDYNDDGSINILDLNTIKHTLLIK